MAVDYEAYFSLKAEIEQLGREMRSGEPIAPAARAELGARIAKTLNHFEFLLKSEAYQALSSGEEPAIGVEEPIQSEEPEIDREVLVKRAGYPGVCSDCDRDDCVCFSHLPRPKISVRPSRLCKISFPVEYQLTDKVAWLKAMRMAIVKREKK